MIFLANPLHLMRGVDLGCPPQSSMIKPPFYFFDARARPSISIQDTTCRHPWRQYISYCNNVIILIINCGGRYRVWIIIDSLYCNSCNSIVSFNKSREIPNHRRGILFSCPRIWCKCNNMLRQRWARGAGDFNWMCWCCCRCCSWTVVVVVLVVAVKNPNLTQMMTAQATKKAYWQMRQRAGKREHSFSEYHLAI